nr:hypothetical protein [Kofleriaceae bacterium]
MKERLALVVALSVVGFVACSKGKPTVDAGLGSGGSDGGSAGSGSDGSDGSDADCASCDAADEFCGSISSGARPFVSPDDALTDGCNEIPNACFPTPTCDCIVQNITGCANPSCTGSADTGFTVSCGNP